MIKDKKNSFSPFVLNAKGQLLQLNTPRIMGILNVTSDSFFAGSRFNEIDRALAKVTEMLANGADIVDIGGYSTRPGADDIPEDVEIERVVPVIVAIKEQYPDAFISVDTFRASVALEAVKAGAAMVNDVSGGTLDEKMFTTIAKLQVPYVLMHYRGNPKTMLQLTQYNNLPENLMNFFLEAIHKLEQMGFYDIIIDPGFGFAKNLDQNYFLLENLQIFQQLGKPILVGVSRKSMIYKKLGVSPESALNGTTVLNSIALTKGANILRVHDVKEAKEIVRLLF